MKRFIFDISVRGVAEVYAETEAEARELAIENFDFDSMWGYQINDLESVVEVDEDLNEIEENENE